jgi:hypothetical protein
VLHRSPSPLRLSFSLMLLMDRSLTPVNKTPTHTQPFPRAPLLSLQGTFTYYKVVRLPGFTYEEDLPPVHELLDPAEEE